MRRQRHDRLFNNAMTATLLVLPYTINGVSYGLPLSVVDQVAPVVEITPATGVRREVLGIINVYGEIMQVVSMRRVFGAPDRRLQLSDRLIFVRTNAGRRALLVDTVGEAIEVSVDTSDEREGSGFTGTVAVLPEGIMQIHDPSVFSAGELPAAQQIALIGVG